MHQPPRKRDEILDGVEPDTGRDWVSSYNYDESVESVHVRRRRSEHLSQQWRRRKIGAGKPTLYAPSAATGGQNGEAAGRQLDPLRCIDHSGTGSDTHRRTVEGHRVNIDLQPDQFSRQFWEPGILLAGIANGGGQVSPFDPTSGEQRLAEDLDARLKVRLGAGRQDADPEDLRRWLPHSGERHGKVGKGKGGQRGE